MDALAKNLWLLLTLVIPGMTTYGALRLLILFDSTRADKAVFDKIDASALLTTCVITALALIQQAIAIVLEAVASLACRLFRHRWRRLYRLFCERFKMAARNELNEGTTRIIGSFFTSLNVTIGQALILTYLLWYEGRSLANSPATWVITALILVGGISTGFRLCNACSIIDEIESKPLQAGPK